MTSIMESPIPIPGSFMQEPDTTFHCSRFNASVFLPPVDDTCRSSAASQQGQRQSISRSSPSHRSEQSQHSRKRQRLDTTDDTLDTPLGDPNDSYFQKWSSGRDTRSPPPMVDTNYRFAGGLDAPTALTAQNEDDAHEFDYEVDCRPNRYQQNPVHSMDSSVPQTPASNEHGRKRRLSRSPKGWGKTMWALTGGIAGKVFNFCWSNTFRGFYAGGGNGYQFDLGTPDVASRAWTEVDTTNDVFHHDYKAPLRREQSPVPGGFPEDADFIDDYMSNPVAGHQRNHATPTMNSDQDPSSTLRASWVVLDGPQTESRETSPVRKKARTSTANLHTRSTARHVNSQSHVHARKSPRSPMASYASPRNSLNYNVTSQPRQSLPAVRSDVHRPDSIPNNHHPKRPSSRASLASPRRQSAHHVTSSTPPSPAVRKFEQKMRRKEARQDQTMNRFNAQLQAMIREGQQALGSKVEVEVLDSADIDEGYEEGVGVESWEREYVRPGVWS
ncbi:uncharacterized protein Z518_08447 [Rhinocladiella mackenziei CBS 650.93]|uniref:Rhinocladiella mackenziei CBS 650.93 unplaced genomic scaffold supercont1.6, whole genome shotgun sequence n=1 Tax=Rhinocladiella mackenziei CBS 650.93 TaxID=1442369 RepID=A0A0D2IGX3_9EURO|nr:uncharacterized protein Z518_08447 [Rhinocladiella mackenziei CBS 650.93]KIX02506.1 hypothetical protein Z518_08447 [Rhinocladiella mackenziei CBS 650.93]